MCSWCSRGSGPCTCPVWCGDPSCLLAPPKPKRAAAPGGMDRESWAAWNDIARWDSWDARFTRER